MADYKDIFLKDQQEISDEDLLKYLDEKTPDEEKYAIEKKLINTSFESDALEGLWKVDSRRLQKHVSQLNNTLHKHLLTKKQRKQKGTIKDFQWIILTIILLIFISLAGYGLILMFN